MDSRQVEFSPSHILGLWQLVAEVFIASCHFYFDVLPVLDAINRLNFIELIN